MKTKLNRLRFSNVLARKNMKKMDELLSRPKSQEILEAVRLRDQWWKTYWAERGLEYPV